MIVKGYCEVPSNEVFAIYVLDKQNTMLIPCEGVMGIHEAVDVLGDAVSVLEKDGYHVVFDIRKDTNFDVTKFKPYVQRLV